MHAGRRIAAAVSSVALACFTLAAAAQPSGSHYPAKPIRVYIGFSAGSEIDTIGRLVAQKMSESLGQPLVVETRTGAGGTLAADAVAKAAPDGYTLLVNSVSHAGVQALYPKLPFDTLKDFSPVSQLTSAPNVLLVAPSAGIRSVKDLVAMAKDKPGQVNFGSAGVGSGTHMTLEQFRLATGIQVAHVPYKGVPEVMTDTATGRVHTSFAPIGNALGMVKDGRLVPLAVSTTARVPSLPDVPTLAEAGVPLDWDQWYGMFAPARTPPQIVGQLSREVAKALAAPDVRERIVNRGSVPKASTPEEFEAFVRAEVAKVGKVIRDGNIRIE
jgi:tripartite-type tricarboxylate transporter receptor subunit TctC